MRLSEAIRLGAMLRPQGFIKTLAHSGSCAMGAAVEATGGSVPATYEDAMAHLVHRWPFVFAAELVTYPPCGCGMAGFKSTVRACVLHLNDTHRWTREQIADWVQVIEPTLDASDAERASTRDVSSALQAVSVYGEGGKL